MSQTLIPSSVGSSTDVGSVIVFKIIQPQTSVKTPIQRPAIPTPPIVRKVSKAPSYQYSDIDFISFGNPVTGDTTRIFDLQAIKTSVRNIILSNSFEKLHNPLFGAGITSELFENFSPSIQFIVQKKIVYALSNYEPRVKVNQVTVKGVPEQNSVSVNIVYTIISEQIKQETTIMLERIR